MPYSAGDPAWILCHDLKMFGGDSVRNFRRIFQRGDHDDHAILLEGFGGNTAPRIVL